MIDRPHGIGNSRGVSGSIDHHPSDNSRRIFRENSTTSSTTSEGAKTKKSDPNQSNDELNANCGHMLVRPQRAPRPLRTALWALSIPSVLHIWITSRWSGKCLAMLGRL